MGASRKPKQVEVKLNLFTKMIDLNNKAEQQVAADNIQKLRFSVFIIHVSAPFRSKILLQIMPLR